MALTMFWAANAPMEVASNIADSWVGLAWYGGREVILGASLGWLLSLCLTPLRIAGSFLAEELGLTFATMTSPLAESGNGNVLSSVFESFGVLLVFVLNLHLGFLLIFNHFWHVCPVGGKWDTLASGWVTQAIGSLPAHGISIVAAPAIAMALVLVSILAIMKQTPQFNLFAFGMPYRLAAGLLILVVFLPDVVQSMAHFLKSFVLAPETLFQA